MAVDLEKRRFTVDEYYRMADAGIFARGDRIELIDGDILTMCPIGSPHGAAVDRATRALVLAAGVSAIVRVQGPVWLNPFTEPEPDLTLLRPCDDFYKSGHPHPADVLLVIEIAESSLRYDREIKAPLYARNGIVEYWLVDLSASTVTIQSEIENGTYSRATVHRRGEILSPRYLPQCLVGVDDLL